MTAGRVGLSARDARSSQREFGKMQTSRSLLPAVSSYTALLFFFFGRSSAVSPPSATAGAGIAAASSALRFFSFLAAFRAALSAAAESVVTLSAAEAADRADVDGSGAAGTGVGSDVGKGTVSLSRFVKRYRQRKAVQRTGRRRGSGNSGLLSLLRRLLCPFALLLALSLALLRLNVDSSLRRRAGSNRLGRRDRCRLGCRRRCSGRRSLSLLLGLDGGERGGVRVLGLLLL